MSVGCATMEFQRGNQGPSGRVLEGQDVFSFTAVQSIAEGEELCLSYTGAGVQQLPQIACQQPQFDMIVRVCAFVRII